MLRSFLIFFSVFLAFPNLGFCQDSTIVKPQKSGYDYFKSGLRIGYTVGRYTYLQSGPEIYMYRINHGYIPSAGAQRRYLSIDDQFTSLRDFRGVHVGFEAGEDNMRLEMYFTTRTSRSDAKYTYDTGENTPIIKEHEKVRIRYNAVTFAYGYRFDRIPNLMLGVCTDIGILRTDIKNSSHAESKWNPWFYSFKFLGSGVSPRTPVLTYGLFLNFDLGPVSLKWAQNFTFLDGDLNSETYKYTNIPWSSKNFPMANTSVTAAIKI